MHIADIRTFFRVSTVKTTPYVLKKFANYPPSLVVHLHPTHFRFEQQDGSFPYNSEMNFIIEHIRKGTVPHDMIEELLRGGIRFYEGESIPERGIYEFTLRPFLFLSRLSYCTGGGPQVGIGGGAQSICISIG